MKLTNLEYYTLEACVTENQDIILYTTTDKWIKKWEEWGGGQREDLESWLLEEYEPPKYKITKIEYDILDSLPKYMIGDNEMVFNMIKKGYFKNVDVNIPVSDFLRNCEIINGEK